MELHINDLHRTVPLWNSRSSSTQSPVPTWFIASSDGKQVACPGVLDGNLLALEGDMIL